MPSRPLSVAVVYGTFPPQREGGADFLANFTPALAETGARVQVVTSAGRGAAREQLADGVTVHRIVPDWTFSKRGRVALDKVNDLLREESVEVVHVIFPDSVLQGTYHLPAAIGFPSIPLVATFWNLGLGRRSPLPIKLEALALLGRSAVLTSHDPAYLQALRRIAAGLKPVRWLPIGSNIGTETHRTATAVRREHGLDDAPTLAYFGHLDFTRGIEDLFAALAGLRRGRRDVRLVMLGGADTKRYGEYAHLAERLRIDDAILWTPYLEPQAAADMLGSVDICVLPYRRNHLGRSALAAALRLGVPTILAGTPERIAPLRPGDDVELVRPGAPMELGAAIARLLDDPERRMQLAAGARRAGRLFEWPRVAAAARGIYLEAISRRFRTARGGSGRADA
jgi:glycosyltransferase involved in cell wall biosynthesis